MGFAPGYLWAPVAGAIELLGGIALILGLLTRPAALLLLAEQLVALLVVHLPHGFFLKPTGPDGFEYNLVLVGTFLALVFLGSGKIGLDEEIRRKKGRTVYRERRVAPPEAPRPPPGAAP
jgi:putative oxidoreductase